MAHFLRMFISYVVFAVQCLLSIGPANAQFLCFDADGGVTVETAEQQKACASHWQKTEPTSPQSGQVKETCGCIDVPIGLAGDATQQRHSVKVPAAFELVFWAIAFLPQQLAQPTLALRHPGFCTASPPCPSLAGLRTVVLLI